MKALEPKKATWSRAYSADIICISVIVFVIVIYAPG